MRSVSTRFRAYQLGTPGSSFSYCANGKFTLLEGRLTKESHLSLVHEMDMCGVTLADTLHITSWDADHCAASELGDLLELVQPRKIECPGYDPHTDNGVKCSKLIRDYQNKKKTTNRPVRLQYITPLYIQGLTTAERLAFNDIFYNPYRVDDECTNNNSTVQLFRAGSFNVLSLGDVESTDISARLRRCRILRRETDVMILAHHGADNGFTNKNFLTHIDPQIAICSSDYDNTYDHPHENIKRLLYEHDICLMTTKTGDVLIKSIGDHTGRFRAINFKANSTEISSARDFTAKKTRLLAMNQDTIRQLYAPAPPHPHR